MKFVSLRPAAHNTASVCGKVTWPVWMWAAPTTLLLLNDKDETDTLSFDWWQRSSHPKSMASVFVRFDTVVLEHTDQINATEKLKKRRCMQKFSMKSIDHHYAITIRKQNTSLCLLEWFLQWIVSIFLPPILNIQLRRSYSYVNSKKNTIPFSKITIPARFFTQHTLQQHVARNVEDILSAYIITVLIL